jgi:hypothetical protein
VNATSGLVLFSLYPIKAVSNPGFFIKMFGVVLAVVCLRRIKRQVFGNPAILDTGPVPVADRILAAIALFVWLVTVTAGRLMAYHGIAGVEWASALAVAVVTLLLVVAGFVAAPLVRSSRRSLVKVNHLPAIER